MARGKTDYSQGTEDQIADGYELLLFNDDVNTFDFVIESLIEVCDHDPVSAEQCTLVTHFRGKCAVRHGELIELESMGQALSDRGLSITIN